MIIINKKQDPKLSDFLARAFFKAWVKVAVVLTAVKLLFILDHTLGPRNESILKTQQRFKTERHNVFTEGINKIA